MMWPQETGDLLRETERVRQQLVNLTAQLDGFVERLKAASAQEDEEGRGPAEE